MPDQNTLSLSFAIDPGVKGAIAAGLSDGTLVGIQNFTTIHDMATYMFDISSVYWSLSPTAILESVHSSPGMGVKSAFTFGQNFGEWQGLLAAMKMPTRLVKPQEWQRGISGLKGTEGPNRKRVLKAEAQRRYPNQKVTLTNADALLLLDYGFKFSN
jgi:hypothetical protein